MANRIVIDGRNIYDPDRVRGLGFEYYSIGRK
jgi:UDPglucose 6-dehydrogenase